VSAPPPVARELFGAKLPQAQAYAALLAEAGVERGLIGPSEAARIWERHLINSGLVAELLPETAAEAGQLADLGSGAGLPGIVLAILRPDLRVTLVEPMARRTAFLAECVNDLELSNVEIRRGRAEDLASEMQADVVTARAVARLDRLAVLAAGLCRPGGLVLAIKGASAAAELDHARPALRRLGATDAEVVTAGDDLVARELIEQPTTVVRFRVGPSGLLSASARGSGRERGSGHRARSRPAAGPGPALRPDARVATRRSRGRGRSV
jgi:16S rRNA (guanine527-N7)-methyltransferase